MNRPELDKLKDYIGILTMEEYHNILKIVINILDEKDEIINNLIEDYKELYTKGNK